MTVPAESPSKPSELVTRLRSGDGAAAEELVRTYGGPLLRTIRRFLPGDADAQDALQDTFVSAFRGIGQFDARSQLGTWLHRIAVNAALMKLRGRRRRPEASIESLLPHFGPDEHQIDPPAPWPDRSDDDLVRAETFCSCATSKN